MARKSRIKLASMKGGKLRSHLSIRRRVRTTSRLDLEDTIILMEKVFISTQTLKIRRSISTHNLRHLTPTNASLVSINQI